MDYPCAKFGDFSFSRFGFIVRTHAQTESHMLNALLVRLLSAREINYSQSQNTSWRRSTVVERWFWRTFPVLRRTASWADDHFVGQTSAVGQPTRPTQPFILTGSINEQ